MYTSKKGKNDVVPMILNEQGFTDLESLKMETIMSLLQLQIREKDILSLH